MTDEIRNVSDFDEIAIKPEKDYSCYCPKCRRMSYGQLRRFGNKVELGIITGELKLRLGYVPYLLSDLYLNSYDGSSLVCVHTCRQCHNETFLIKHKINGKPTLTFLYSTTLQYDTSYVPEGVNYYMEQALRSRSIGAYSAAMAMYRSALEWLLFSLGFKEKDLNTKIDKFEDSEYSEKIGTEFMDILRLLGNNAVHVNDGDLSLQKSFDDDMLNATEELLNELINQIFVGPEEHKKRVEKMKSGLTEVQLKRYQKEYE